MAIKKSTVSNIAGKLTSLEPTITYSATELNEAEANDGSIADVITLTLTGDTFYTDSEAFPFGIDLNAVLGANSVVSNVPEGLTAILTLVDANTAELSFTGTATNNAAVDLTAIQVSLRSTYFESSVAAQNANQLISIAFQDTPSLTAEGSFTESANDDGSIAGNVTITLHNSSFAADLIGTDLNADGAYVENISAGLTAVLTVTSATTAELTLTGNADNADAADSINDLTYGFKPENFESGSLPAGAEMQTVDVAFIEPRLTWSDDAKINDDQQDGNFDSQSVTLTLEDGAKFDGVGADLTQFVGNIPEGLTATLVVDSTDATKATLTVTGDTEVLAAGAVDALEINLPKLVFANRMNVADRLSTVELTFEDKVAPAAPEFVDVSDNSITPAERADGVTISGTTEANATVTLTFVDGTTVEENATKDGIWEHLLTNSDYTAGVETITAVATDTAGNTDTTATSTAEIKFASPKPTTGNDKLIGTAKNDTLNGGLGFDALTGGKGADKFVLTSIKDAPLSHSKIEVITDFSNSEKDKIDLSKIDADTSKAKDQAFSKPVMGAEFSGVFTKAGQLFFDTTDHILYGSVNNDGSANFSIQLNGVSSLVAGDFVL